MHSRATNEMHLIKQRRQLVGLKRGRRNGHEERRVDASRVVAAHTLLEFSDCSAHLPHSIRALGLVVRFYLSSKILSIIPRLIVLDVQLRVQIELAVIIGRRIAFFIGLAINRGN